MRKFFALIIILLLATPFKAEAAKLELKGPQEKEIPLQSQFEVIVGIDTETDTLNAFSGSITFPSNTLALQTIRDGNSIIGLWVEAPHEVPITATLHSVNFSGTIPGGFNGTDRLFSLVFQAVSADPEARITPTELVSLKHDGLGTQVATTSKPLLFTLQPGDPPSGKVEAESLIDTTPPFGIEAHIIQDQNLQDGKWTAVFTATDPESGIEHYEIQESDSSTPREQGWAIAASPYPLQDQERKNWVHIKAINRAGLSTTTSIEPIKKPVLAPTTITAQTVLKLLGLLAIIIIILLVIWKRASRHKREQISTHN